MATEHLLYHSSLRLKAMLSNSGHCTPPPFPPSPPSDDTQPYACMRRRLLLKYFSAEWKVPEAPRMAPSGCGDGGWIGGEGGAKRSAMSTQCCGVKQT